MQNSSPQKSKWLPNNFSKIWQTRLAKFLGAAFIAAFVGLIADLTAIYDWITENQNKETAIVLNISQDEFEAILDASLTKRSTERREAVKSQLMVEDSDRLAIQAEIDRKKQEVAELERRKSDVAAAFEESAKRANEIWDALVDLDRRGDLLVETDFEKAKDALRNGNYGIADALFGSVMLSGNRQQKSIAAYGRGLIAEEQALWPEAAEFFVEAAGFNEDQKTLSKAAHFSGLIEQPMKAYGFAVKLQEQASKDFGNQSKEFADASLILADALVNLGRFDEAKAALEDAMRVAGVIYEEDSPDLANVFFSAATYLARASSSDPNIDRLILALNYFQKAYDVFLAQGVDGKEDLATVALAYGALLATLGQTDLANSLIDDAIAMQLENYGTDHPVYASSLSYRVVALFAQERYSEALEDIEVMSRINLEYGLMSRYADSLSTIARIKWNLEEDFEAMSLFEKSLLLQREISGRDGDDYSSDLEDFGQFLIGRSFARAVPIYEELAEIYRARYGSSSLQYLVALTGLSHSYHCSGQKQSAIDTAQKLKTLAARKYEQDDENVVGAVRILDLAEQGDTSIEECLEIGPLSSHN